MLKKSSLALLGAALFLAWNGLLLLFLWGRPGAPPSAPNPQLGPDSRLLPAQLLQLAQDAEAELRLQRDLLLQIQQLGRLQRRRTPKPARKTPKPPGKAAEIAAEPPVLPVLVLACDRSSVRRCLDKILRYRPSARRFPVIVSQDCGHAETAAVIASYGAAVAHIRQPDLGDVPVPPEHRKFQGYYKISRHYRWALGQVFRTFRYRAAIVVEDDLEVAPDFFEYFQAVLPLLQEDRSLWCASAWNDNGKEGLVDAGRAELLYRTDFFPGLGWLLLAELWDELEPKWPPAFWDDWMRQPEQRRGRACVRPEVSRTMTFGRKGVSHGQFYDQYLKFIKLNDRFVPFTQMDLSYLKKDEYERFFLQQVYSAPEIRLEELQKDSGRDLGAVRLQYRGRDSFKALAKALGLMDDLKSGVPRAGYRGVVSFVCRGRRVFLAPPSDWTGYDPSWS
ncbi:alpha-1,3-mannosyl-glycoprotein 2-beta-N-acetylglucosaminyltransferase [Onychostruthus taczanowskii]|uniref:alpha-1,3-mannosyl-glycoprotein 2-beta-N-acetylglucosaminyltransferase n=1 Tax=Onychostruthus taczanowskii TaxID=356909 RepID=UPI001B804F93|nr:alpha-1,3-mannosyl-glycoprotein 2-beta-N-acetylglucosaminyltransferase [Onychostruthus taczanowskii]XP_041270200.1 alpha-1,3-mannosyl-glycoprotein 2-beta-N-acetylglucosaminyltransferase [Onychostruthus taczanowskii]